MELLEFDEFKKVELAVGLVTEAVAIEKSKKLLKLTVDLGEDSPRTIVAGIAEFYSPEDITGKRIVVVANLKPATLMGVTSQGMLLAVQDKEIGMSLVTVDKDAVPGGRLS